MNILTDILPTSVRIGGTEYAINSDFRTSVRFLILTEEEELTEIELLREALWLYYPVIPQDISAAVAKIQWFVEMGAEKKPTENGDEEEEPPQEKKLYSFKHDADYIYSAFYQEYGLDLTREHLHWWKFCALLHGMSEDTKLFQIIGIRGTKITDKMSKEQKAYYRKMQKVYALPLSDAEQKRQDAIAYALQHGGDLTGLI